MRRLRLRAAVNGGCNARVSRPCGVCGGGRNSVWLRWKQTGVSSSRGGHPPLDVCCLGIYTWHVYVLLFLLAWPCVTCSQQEPWHPAFPSSFSHACGILGTVRGCKCLEASALCGVPIAASAHPTDGLIPFSRGRGAYRQRCLPSRCAACEPPPAPALCLLRSSYLLQTPSRLASPLRISL